MNALPAVEVESSDLVSIHTGFAKMPFFQRVCRGQKPALESKTFSQPCFQNPATKSEKKYHSCHLTQFLLVLLYTEWSSSGLDLCFYNSLSASCLLLWRWFVRSYRHFSLQAGKWAELSSHGASPHLASRQVAWSNGRQPSEAVGQAWERFELCFLALWILFTQQQVFEHELLRPLHRHFP